MMRRTLMLIIVAAGALLQQLLPGWAVCGGIKPPIIAAITLHYALRKTKREMLAAMLFAAVLQDGLDLGSFGPALLAFPVVCLLAYRIRNEIFADGLVTQLVLGGLLGLFTTLVAALVYTVNGQRIMQPGIVFLRLFSSVWLGMATLPLVSHAINGIEAAIPKRKGYGWQ